MAGDLASRPKIDELVTSRRRLFVVLVAATMISMTLPLPWRLASLGFGGVAIVVGIMSLVAQSTQRRERKRSGQEATTPSWTIVTALLLGVVVVMVVFSLMEAALYPIISERDRCLAGANTQTAAEACQTSVEDRLHDIQQRLENQR